MEKRKLNKFIVEIVSDVSKKTNKPYQCIRLSSIDGTYSKVVFVDRNELMLINLLEEKR